MKDTGTHTTSTSTDTGKDGNPQPHKLSLESRKHSKAKQKILKKWKWDSRFLDIAVLVASWSKDPSTKVGAVVVKDREIKSTGYNGFPKGIEDSDERLHDRETKYKYVVHAERNALIQAGKECEGATLYIAGLPPCSECAKQIIQAGIETVKVGDIDRPERWESDMCLAQNMLAEAGIPIETLPSQEQLKKHNAKL